MKGFLSKCLACAVWLVVAAVTAASAASTLPVPAGQKTFAVNAVPAPVIGNDPANIIPIGIGPFANGMDTVSIKVGLAPFAGAVDLYFVLYIPDLDKSYIYYTGEESEPFTTIPTAWKNNVTAAVNETVSYLDDVSASQLPEATYYLGLVAVPAGSSPSAPSAYDIWVTQFKVVTNGRTLTLTSNCKQDIWVGAVGNNATKSCTKEDEKNSAECNGFDCKNHVCTDFACISNADCVAANSYCSELSKSNDTHCTTDAVCGTSKFCGPVNKQCSWRSCTYVPLPVMTSDIVEPQKTCRKNADCCSGAGCTMFCYITEGDSGRCAKVPPQGRGNNWHMASGTSQPQTLTMGVPTPWGGRIWPRTGCANVPTPLPQYAGSDAQCPAGAKIDNKTSHQYEMNCRADSDCGQKLTDLGGKCIKTTPNFDAGVPDASECTPGNDASCDTKYPGQKRVCISQKKSIGGHETTVGQCGFYKCTSYQCVGQTFTCATGNCTDAAGKSSPSCATSGKGSPTVAELFMRSLADVADYADYYDVSMVDGGNVPVQLSPDPDTYDLTGTDAVKSPQSKATCSTDADCIMSNDDGTKDTSWVCSARNDGTKGKCINRLVCGGPGCVSDCAKYGFGLTEKSTWGGRDLAITKDACPSALELLVGGNYVGCLSPKDACSDGTDYQKTTLQCGKHIDGQDSYLQMFQCTGKNADTCYKAGVPATCCGCPDWSFQGGKGCVNSNPYWTTKVGPATTTPEELYRVFHKASPSSYTFPFDDKTALFTCKGKPRDAENPNGVGVNYTITFCPK